MLVDEFCIGAKKAGHEVVCFETAKLDINPCIGCYHCRKNDGQCVYNDDMTQIYPHLLTADALVAHFHSICHYLNWQEGGMVLAVGAYTREDAENSDYLTMAKNLGEML